MTDQEDHAEGTGENQVNEEQSNFGFTIVDPDTQVQMKKYFTINSSSFLW